MGLGRPVSRILLYPAIHLRGIPGPLAGPRLPAGRTAPGQFGLLAPVVYLAGPSRDAAGGLLPHPFTHHLCRGKAPRPSAGLLSVALYAATGRTARTHPNYTLQAIRLAPGAVWSHRVGRARSWSA